MGKKVHYKLHKVKKQWVTIAVTSAALASIVGGATVANQIGRASCRERV